MKLNIIDLFRYYYFNKEFGKTKDCPKEDFLYKYTFSLLPQHEVDLFEKHLKVCAYCSKKLTEISLAKNLDEKIAELQEDKELTKKIYDFLQKHKIQPKKFLILKKIGRLFHTVSKSIIFEEIPTIKYKLEPTVGFSFLTVPPSEKLTYKIKYKNISGNFTIKAISSTELEISFKNLPKDTELKIDTQTSKVIKEDTEIKFVLPLKDRYEVTISSSVLGQQLQYDLYVE